MSSILFKRKISHHVSPCHYCVSFFSGENCIYNPPYIDALFHCDHIISVCDPLVFIIYTWSVQWCKTGCSIAPGVQSSNTSRVRFTVISHTPVRSRFYHIHILYKRNWDCSWLINFTQKVTRSYIFFKFAICSITLLSLGETCHLKGRDMLTVWRTVLLLSCYHCDSTRQHYDVTQFVNILWRRTMHEWVMNIHYKTSRAIHKHDPHPLEIMGRVW